MPRSLIAALAILALTGIGAVAYVTLRPAPAAAPDATSTTPVADATQASSTPTPTIVPTTTSEQPPATTTPVVEQPVPPAPTATTSGFKTYRNEEWGFSFRYPHNWHLQIPAWGSKVSKFNMALWPIEGKHLPDPISVNITSKEWIDRAIVAMKAQGDVVENVTINGYPAVRYESTDSGLPSVGYVFYVDDIQINLEGKQDERYLEVLTDVLDSFVITATSTPNN